MISSTVFSGQKFAILGLARSGLATLDALLASGAHCTVWDSRAEAREAVTDRAQIGDPMEIDLSGFEALVVSPGVPLNTHPIAKKAAQDGCPIIGDIELFARARASLPKHFVIGITGTNGKSTVTSLVTHLLKSAGVPALAGGNIGLPVLSREPLPEGGVYVLELSSYQLDLTYSLVCDVAALINITPDHLDRYDSFEDYAAAKARLFDMQGKTNIAVFGDSDAPTRSISMRQSQRDDGPVVKIPRSQDLQELQPEWPALQGPHNLLNAVLAVSIVDALGLELNEWRPALKSFAGLEHRMEVIGSYDGVTYVNDSKATNPEAAAPALAAWPPNEQYQQRRIHWIVGGQPKGETLGPCEAWLGHVAHAYCIGAAGPAFARMLREHVPVTEAGDLEKAVHVAVANVRKGDVVLLSPACASFDQFRDFEDRGRQFRQILLNRLGPHMDKPDRASPSGKASQ